MNFTATIARLNLSSQRFALMWAKEHLSLEEYNKIYTSYRLLMKKTAMFVVGCCLPIIFIFVFLTINTPIYNHLEATNTPKGASYVYARVDYDGNFYWTNDSKKYEYALSDYGLVSDDYQFGDKIKVYINDNQEIIKVSANQDYANIKDIEIGTYLISSILIPVILIFCIFRPIACRTFGKEWFEFYKKF